MLTIVRIIPYGGLLVTAYAADKLAGGGLGLACLGLGLVAALVTVICARIEIEMRR